MQICLHNVGKKFQKQWIIRGLSYTFETGKSYALTGSNGEGKSTVLQLISGILPPTEGDVQYKENNREVESFHTYQVIATPYQELIEDFTLAEHLQFHFRFKKKSDRFESLLQTSGIATSLKKQVKYYSSGMKQRLKLLLAMGTDVPVLLLDEPTSNLDEQGMEWYKKNIMEIKKEKLVVIASNSPFEYDFCDEVLKVTSFKPLI